MNTSAFIILVAGVIIAIAMSVVVAVFVGRRPLGECFATFTSLLVSFLAVWFPPSTITKTQRTVFIVITSGLAWTIYRLVSKRIRSRENPPT